MLIQEEVAGDQPSVASAFGFGAQTPGGTIYTAETITQSSTETPQEEPAGETPVSVVPEADTVPQGDQVSSPAVQTEEEKRMVIDTVESQLDKFDQGIISAEELQHFFKDKPELASIANKSKRVKERYRSFVDGKHPRLQLAETPVEAKEDTPMPTISDEKPLTLKDLDQYYAQKEASLMEKQLQEEKSKQFLQFAVSQGLKDDQVTAVQKTAEALSTVHEDWSWQDAMTAAYRAVTGEVKPKPVNVLIGSQTPNIHSSSDSQERVDLSKGTWTADPAAFGFTGR